MLRASRNSSEPWAAARRSYDSVRKTHSPASRRLDPGNRALRNRRPKFFSGIGSGTFNSTQTPFGFWIWCESDSSNPYLHECNGSMYFYDLGIVQGVEDPSASAFQELSPGIYQITVVDRTTGGSIINCMLTNESSKHGPSNNVDVQCTTPSGTTQVQHAVVNVTGP